ncbi:hypothetical protein [Rheinheimera sp.]|uniref:hypothetical protein n=1 Tax=Rheinheimera sp. TaxID=1869214 RepID=UPI0027326D22|nr:hypothetical protein [Rheinheimera sp.]MDP2714538.1 hypothetical protein [Rheinheimera sp.]
MKHISGSIMVALLSMTMTGCIFEKSNRTPLEFSSTAPTTAVVGQEYRYNITVTPETARDYEITVEGAPDWLELQTAAAQPVKVGNFEGVVPYMAADGEDIYFYAITSSFGLPSFWIYKTRIDSNEEPQIVFNPSEGFEGFGGLTINNRVLYIAENKGRDANATTVFHKLNLADSNPQPEVIREAPGHARSIAVKDDTLYWTDGSITRKYFSFNDKTKIIELVGERNWQTLGTDAYGFIHVATTNNFSYFLVELTNAIRPLYTSSEASCTAGMAGYANQGTYFANTSCYSNGEQKQGNLRFVAVDGESDTSSSGTVVYREGEIIAGPASAVTVTGSGQVVWASEADRTLKTFTVQQNTLVGSPTEAGTYDITLTLPGGATQEFTLTVTAPPVSYDVTGTVYGLQGSLQLSNNGTDILRISTAAEDSSPFSFTTQLQQGEAFDVAVLANPTGQTCSVRDESAATGTMGTADVELIVDCEFNTYNISGTVEGLNGELELLLSSEQGDEELLVNEDGAFSFTGEFIQGDEYSLTIQTQPVGQVCELNVSFTDENGEATNPVVSGPVDLPISCTTNETPRSLSVTVTGLTDGATVEMRAFGPEDGRWELEDKTFTTGTAAFSNTLLDSEPFAIGIQAQPEGYFCTITDEAPLFDIVDGLGIVDGNVSVSVTCEAEVVVPPRTLSVTVTGLPGGSSVAMQATGPLDGRWLTESKAFATGTAAFDNTMLDGETFDIRKILDPDGFTCSITGESPLDGAVDGLGIVNGNVTITVNCTADVVATPRTLSVTVIGLPLDGTTVAMRAFGPEDGRWLQENQAFATGTGSFTNTMLDGEIFDIRIIAQPGGFTCSITDEAPLDGPVDGFGTVDGDVTITVDCI